VSTLECLAAWFTRLAAVTRAPRDWASTESALPLRGAYRELEVLRTQLRAVPGVLVHGDVGTGVNLLVKQNTFCVIDWETAVERELPLTDLLPMLCYALAAARGQSGPTAMAEYVLRLCAGHESESGWLLSLVRGYCRQIGVPLDQAGALGALAWGYQASMRLVHQELMVNAGDVAVDWESPADGIARSWMSAPNLGTKWSALTAESAT
jgi:hypothetical protein